MALTIGGITLDHDLRWENEYEYVPLVGSSDRTIDGNLVVQSFKLYGGQPMTLSGGSDHGWQKRSTVIALQGLLATPGQSFSVVLPDTRSFTVIFRPDEIPAMSFTPVTLASAPDGDFWYYGTIKLVIIATL